MMKTFFNNKQYIYSLLTLIFFSPILIFVLISLINKNNLNDDNNINIEPKYGYDYYGFDTKNFYLMPPNTNKTMIMQALNDIVVENPNVSFNSSAVNCYNLPYIEFLYPENDGYYYVYSSSNGYGYLYTTNNTYLVYDDNIKVNPFRFYMWGFSVFNLEIEPTINYPIEKNIKFKTKNNFYQKMFLKAKTSIDNNTFPYVETIVYRETVYVYYPSYMIYCLVDVKMEKIYIMQSGNNQLTKETPLTYSNMIFNLNYLNLPPNFLFLTVQLNNTQTICVVSTLNEPAILIQDNMYNTYQFTNKKYSEFLYQQFL